jgi:flavorubredoxin
MNNQLYPTLADVVTYMKGLKPKNMTGIAFGSFGWSGEAAKNLHAAMTDMGFTMPLAAPLAVKYVPGREDLENISKQAQKVAEDLR